MVYQRTLFTKSECEYLIDYRNTIPQTINDGGYPNRKDINYKQWTIARNVDLEFLFSKIVKFTEEMFNVNVKTFDEVAYIYQYEINDGYRMHTDSIHDRRFTIGVQLNDEYLGGELMVDYNGNRIIVDKNIGNCYIFESALLHGVSPVLSGNRFNILTFMFNRNIMYNSKSLI